MKRVDLLSDHLQMKISLTVLCVYAHLFLQAQDAPATGKGWMLGFGVSPDISYRTLRDKGEPYSSQHIAWRNEIERPRIGYSAGFYANCIFYDWFGLGTGVVY